MKRVLKWVGISIAGLLLVAVAAAMVLIGPNNLIGMMRYDQRQEGTLVVGDKAPNIELVGLDGSSREQVRDWVGNKPVVLIFGSFT